MDRVTSKTTSTSAPSRPCVASERDTTGCAAATATRRPTRQSSTRSTTSPRRPAGDRPSDEAAFAARRRATTRAQIASADEQADRGGERREEADRHVPSASEPAARARRSRAGARERSAPVTAPRRPAARLTEQLERELEVVDRVAVARIELGRPLELLDRSPEEHVALHRGVARLLEEERPPQGGEHGTPVGALLGRDHPRQAPLGRGSSRDVGEDLQRRRAARSSRTGRPRRGTRRRPPGRGPFASGPREAGCSAATRPRHAMRRQCRRRASSDPSGGRPPRAPRASRRPRRARRRPRAPDRPEPLARPVHVALPHASRAPNRSLRARRPRRPAPRTASAHGDEPTSVQALLDARVPHELRALEHGVLADDPLEEVPILLRREERDHPQREPGALVRSDLFEQRGRVEAGVVEIAEEQDGERRVALPLNDRPRLGQACRDLRTAAERERPGALLALLRRGRRVEPATPEAGPPEPSGGASKKRRIGRSSSLRVSGGSISYAVSEKTTRPIRPSVSAIDRITRCARCAFCWSTLDERSRTTMPPLPVAK